MKVVSKISAIKNLIDIAKKQKKQIGFVPTMGYLHAGHAALLKQCRKENGLTVLSIFVNPKQFGPKEDFTKYPRDQKKDELLAKKENVDIIFHPSEEEMYPDGYSTYVDVERFSSVLCGHLRPGHFRGVATVVLKLLNVVSPDRLYLGQKDAQQVVVIRNMIRDLNLSVELNVVPTVRESNGLAMSSRNSYLSESQRADAGILYQALKQGKALVIAGERNPQKISHHIKKMIQSNSSGLIEYVSCLDARTLSPSINQSKEILIALAVWFGPARLIDNILINA